MSSCEKCWRDACGDPDRYSVLMLERTENKCTPEEQAGPDRSECDKCGRKTRHQYTRECMACGSHPRMEAIMAARKATGASTPEGAAK